MLHLELSYSEYSLLIQAVLNRIDFLNHLLVDLPVNDTIRGVYESDLSSVLALYNKLKDS